VNGRRVGRRPRSAVVAALVLAAGACAPFLHRNEGRPISSDDAAAPGSTARGVIVGAFVGGAAGVAIGRGMDEQARELQAAVPRATVTRVAEGIHVTLPLGLVYATDSDAVLPEGLLILQELATSLARHVDTQLLIVAHTDAPGEAGYNEDLSWRRADAASRYLVGRGVGPARIRAIGRGEAEAVATNGTQAGRALNRRMEIAIFTSRTERTVERE
jgi:outer membrane protein OmpA-like peptidoglycan-associated protein